MTINRVGAFLVVAAVALAFAFLISIGAVHGNFEALLSGGFLAFVLAHWP